jgi:hypothetical protein
MSGNRYGRIYKRPNTCFDYQSSKRDIKFTFESTEDRLPVWIDRNNFDKVLMNLLINAFKYTKDGGEIKITLTTIKSEMQECKRVC